MELSVEICLFLNKIFPYKKPMGRGSAEEYVKVQMMWAEQSYKKFGSFIDLNGKLLLDAGCGSGGKTFFYSQKGVSKVVGVDFNPKSIDTAVQNFGNTPNVEFLCGSIVQLPFVDNTFDYVILNDVVEHIERPILEAALKELMRVVKQDGRILLEFPPWTSHDASHLYDYISVPWCQLFFSDETLKTVVRKIANERGDSDERVDKLLKDFDELNRITFSESKSMFKKLNFKVIRHDKWVFFNLKFLRYIPFFNKYLTKRVFAILAK
jgi:ubiquinone/menaquinone biosynthesis C-methylase UbiE